MKEVVHYTCRNILAQFGIVRVDGEHPSVNHKCEQMDFSVAFGRAEQQHIM